MFDDNWRGDGRKTSRTHDTFPLSMSERDSKTIGTKLIGMLLLQGRGGATRNVKETNWSFQMAIWLESAAVARSLSHIYFSGASGGVTETGVAQNS